MNPFERFLSRRTKVNDAIWITVFMVVVIAINLGGARLYGEMEFWFAIIKVLTISGLIVLGFVSP